MKPTLEIIVDYDNDKVRIDIGQTLAADGRVIAPSTMSILVRYPSRVEEVLTEVLNLLEPKDVTLSRQSEGQTRTIDEY